MLSFPSQNDDKKMYSEKQTWVTSNQYMSFVSISS